MDKNILKLLSEKPEEGMALLMEQYMGLLWSACRLYLDNPEDIRECVQETFLEFYEHQDRFLPEKGTVKAYLYVIAKRKAIRRLQANGSYVLEPLDENMPDMEDAEEQLLNKAVLEQALSKLREQDSQMIRMKYYDGMTCAQIAHAMNLPMETVKKRQQRSLKKLRRILIALAILGILTACAAAVVYKVRFSPLTGLQGEEEEVWYEMADESISAETEKGNVTIQNVIWKEQKLTVQMVFSNTELTQDELNEVIQIVTNKNFGGLRKAPSVTTRREEGEPIFMELRFSEAEAKEQYTFRIFDTDCTVEMKPISPYTDFAEVGYSQTHNGRTIVLRPEWKENLLSVDAYVYSEDEWKIIGLEDMWNMASVEEYLKWDWKPQSLVDGYSYHYETESDSEKAHSIEIPLLCMRRSFNTETEEDIPIVTIPIPEDSVEVDIPFAVDNDTYRITEVNWSRGTYEYLTGDDNHTEYGDELCIWAEPINIEENTRFVSFRGDIGYPEERSVYRKNPKTGNLEETEKKELVSWKNFGWADYRSLYSQEPVMRMYIEDPEELPKEVRFRITDVYKYWDQSFTFTIKP